MKMVQRELSRMPAQASVSRHTIRHSISLLLLLAIFWLLNSGHYSPLLLFLGAVSTLLVLFLSLKMEVVDDESQPLRWLLRIPGFWFWLIPQIVRSNVDVVIRIWRGNNHITPTLFSLKTSQRTDMGKVVYANSITLTPGTVAIDLDEDSILVHALTQTTMDDLVAGEMDSRISRLEP